MDKTKEGRIQCGRWGQGAEGSCGGKMETTVLEQQQKKKEKERKKKWKQILKKSKTENIISKLERTSVNCGITSKGHNAHVYWRMIGTEKICK